MPIIQHCGYHKHSNDLSSVSAWVEEMKSLEYNPQLLFKQQEEGESQATENIGNRDFILVIQTEFQPDMVREFGKMQYTLTVPTTQTNMISSSLHY